MNRNVELAVIGTVEINEIEGVQGTKYVCVLRVVEIQK